jgi:hypothetical protein
MSVIALLLFRFLAKRSQNILFGFFLILLYFSQLPIQGLMGYSLQTISNSQPAMWLSLLAFYLNFSLGGTNRLVSLVQTFAVFTILMLAMQSTQTFALFSIVPLTYLILTDWTKQKPKIIRFLLLSSCSLIVSIILYKIGLDYWHKIGQQGYALGETTVNILIHKTLRGSLYAINPFTYWGAFKLWSYPFPFNVIPPLGSLKQTVASLIEVSWIIFVSQTILVELRRASKNRREIIFKWLAVLACAVFGMLFLLADSSDLVISDHRPHVTLILVGVILFISGYCFQILASKYSWLSGKLVKYIAIIFVVYSCFGAQANVLRGIVTIGVDQLTFIRNELLNKQPIKNILVILPNKYECLVEPCDVWLGDITSSSWHISQDGGYRYALSTIGENPNAHHIAYVTQIPKGISADTTVINWNKYIVLHERYYGSLFK